MLFVGKEPKLFLLLISPAQKKKGGGKRKEKKKGRTSFSWGKKNSYFSIFDLRFLCLPLLRLFFSPIRHCCRLEDKKKTKQNSSLPTNFFHQDTPVQTPSSPLQRENLRHRGKQLLSHLSQWNLPLVLLTEVRKREKRGQATREKRKKKNVARPLEKPFIRRREEEAISYARPCPHK